MNISFAYLRIISYPNCKVISFLNNKVNLLFLNFVPTLLLSLYVKPLANLKLFMRIFGIPNHSKCVRLMNNLLSTISNNLCYPEYILGIQMKLNSTWRTVHVPNTNPVCYIWRSSRYQTILLFYVVIIFTHLQ